MQKKTKQRAFSFLHPFLLSLNSCSTDFFVGEVRAGCSWLAALARCKVPSGNKLLAADRSKMLCMMPSAPIFFFRFIAVPPVQSVLVHIPTKLVWGLSAQVSPQFILLLNTPKIFTAQKLIVKPKKKNENSIRMKRKKTNKTPRSIYTCDPRWYQKHSQKSYKPLSHRIHARWNEQKEMKEKIMTQRKLLYKMQMQVLHRSTSRLEFVIVKKKIVS